MAVAELLKLNMRIVCISDTHGQHRRVEVPDGDLFIHAGDLTMRGELHVVEDFNDWLGELPHPHKVVIAGNHDFCFEDTRAPVARAALTNCHYLQDEAIEIGGLKIYGTPWVPRLPLWAFSLEEDADLRDEWAAVPEDVDVLVVHGPPHGYGDKIYNGSRVGCTELTKRIREIEPRLVVTGHVHEDYGIYQLGPTKIVNSSVLSAWYKLKNNPVRFDLSD